MLIQSIETTLNELKSLLQQLTTEQYTNPCADLSFASIGAHTRHIIELFQCLENQYESGIINYDNRCRDLAIQTETKTAVQTIEEIIQNLEKPNKKLILQHNIDDDFVSIDSNYYRELLYNLEHCIHHQALIKVAILQGKEISIDDNFGVARSTIAYRKQCAQ